MSQLPLQTRLFLALATVALLPVLVFGIVVVERATSAATSEQETSTLDLARLAAADLPSGQLPDQATASRLASATGAGVTVFGPDGTIRARAGASAVGILPDEAGAGTAGTAGTVSSGQGSVVAVVPVQGSDGQPVAYLAVSQSLPGSSEVGVILAIALTLTVLWALFLSYALARGLIHPMRELTVTLDRLQAGDLSARVAAPSDDEFGRLAESHNRLAGALAARNESLHKVLEALAGLSPSAGIPPLVTAAERAATEAFGFRSVEIVLARDADRPRPESGERVPGEAWQLVTPLRVDSEDVGWLSAVIPPMRDWGPADADLLALFARQFAAAVRNAELYAETQSLSELKSEFLRGVSHNLQTPLTSIRAFAERLASRSDDPAARIIVEQADRLSRLVAQLLTVSRLEAGTLRPQEEVLALAPLIHRAWESLGHAGVSFELQDDSSGWLAVADRDWVDQVVWALLDNAVKHGGGAAIEVAVRHEPGGDPARPGSLVVVVRDHGPGVSAAMRARIFDRFASGGASGGTGLGLNVARGLVEAMGGSIRAEHPGEGAAFVFSLPAEPPGDA
jgi:signal transduction histidine kinase